MEAAHDFLLNLPRETQFAIALILFFAIAFHVRFNSKAVNVGPTILTTLGIFFTFLGIALGLAHFDSANIQESVPSLLGGLKTAFWASVAGVGAALTLKIRDAVFGHETVPLGAADDDVSVGELVRNLAGIQRALVGDDDSSLITQLKLARVETNQRLDGLNNSLADALSSLSQMSSKTLVEALKDVIRDFNEKITEQFGDNFKELNLAVGRVLEWQGNYMKTIERTVAELETVSKLTAKASKDYAVTLDRSNRFAEVATALQDTVTKLRSEQDQLSIVSGALAQLLTQAQGSLPAIELKMVDLAEQLGRGVENSQTVIAKALTEHTASIGQSVQASTKEMAAAQADFSRQVVDMVTKSKEQVTALDAALTDELQKSLQSLGRQLAALSEKFVSDYGPLTDRLRRVVEMARV